MSTMYLYLYWQHKEKSIVLPGTVLGLTEKRQSSLSSADMRKISSLISHVLSALGAHFLENRYLGSAVQVGLLYHSLLACSFPSLFFRLSGRDPISLLTYYSFIPSLTLLGILLKVFSMCMMTSWASEDHFVFAYITMVSMIK